MSKKIISVVLCVVMLFSLGVAAFAADVNYAEVKDNYIYCPSLGFLDFVQNQELPFTYSDAYFTHTGYEYDHALANVSMVLTQASFASASHNASWSDGNENFDALMKQCGFSNLACNEDAVTHPGLETIGIYAASKQIMDNGGAYTLITLSFRGHNYGGEWYGNFDVGTEGNHAGFEKCANAGLDFLKKYIADQNISGRIKVWTTGFSRAAASANMFAGALDKGYDLGNNVTLSPHDIYAYTFETPQGVYDTDGYCRSQLFRNIHNIMNPNDFVPLVSFDAWDQDRYGVDYYTPCRQKDADYESRKPAMVEQVKQMGWMNIGPFTLDTIDDFHYWTVNPVKIIMGETQKTQLEYYDEAIAAMLDVFAPSRQYFVENYQADIQELSSTLLGVDVGRLLNALGIFSTKFMNIQNLAALINSLTITGMVANGTLVDVVVDLLMESLVEAKCANYDGDQVRAMLVKMVPKLLVFVAKYPTTAVNLIANLVQIINAHFSEITHAWLRSTEAEFFAKQGKAIEYQGEYKDVVSSDWFSDEVEYCTLGNIMQGMGDGMFNPNVNTTRAEFATVLYRLEGSPETNTYDPFNDVEKGSWYQKAVAWAYQNGVVKGYSATEFGPNDNITREQVVTMLQRYASRVNPTSMTTGLGAFTDAASVSDWAKPSMEWAVAVEIIGGMGDGTLAPQGMTTRAQIARILQQFCEIKAGIVAA